VNEEFPNEQKPMFLLLAQKGIGKKLAFGVANTIEKAIFAVDVKVGKLLWHRLDYSICVERPGRGVSACREFLGHHNEHRLLPVLLPEPPIAFEAHIIGQE
jgi:hypothetical protein